MRARPHLARGVRLDVARRDRLVALEREAGHALAPLLARLGRQAVCAHLEVETYTWDVLPAEHRAEPVDEAIARELAWTRDKLVARAP